MLVADPHRTTLYRPERSSHRPTRGETPITPSVSEVQDAGDWVNIAAARQAVSDAREARVALRYAARHADAVRQAAEEAARVAELVTREAEEVRRAAEQVACSVVLEAERKPPATLVTLPGRRVGVGELKVQFLCRWAELARQSLAADQCCGPQCRVGDGYRKPTTAGIAM